MKIVQLLINQNPDLIYTKNQDGNTPLHIACENGHMKIVQLLINQNPDLIYTKNQDGNTLLHMACKDGHVEIVQLLINQNPDLIYTKNQDGNTPLHIACLYGHMKIVQLLIKQSPDLIYAKDQDENTMLHMACMGWHAEIVQLLIKQSPDLVYTKNQDGNTPVQIACRNRHVDIVQLLIDKTLTLVDEKGKRGDTALDLVRGGKCKTYLKKYVDGLKKAKEIIEETEKSDSDRVYIAKLLKSYANPSFFKCIFSSRHHKDLAQELSKELLNKENKEKYTDLSACKKLIKAKIEAHGKKHFNESGTFYSLYHQIKNLPEKKENKTAPKPNGSMTDHVSSLENPEQRRQLDNLYEQFGF